MSQCPQPNLGPNHAIHMPSSPFNSGTLAKGVPRSRATVSTGYRGLPQPSHSEHLVHMLPPTDSNTESPLLFRGTVRYSGGGSNCISGCLYEQPHLTWALIIRFTCSFQYSTQYHAQNTFQRVRTLSNRTAFLPKIPLDHRPPGHYIGAPPPALHKSVNRTQISHSVQEL